jgi:hypothetical protein
VFTREKVLPWNERVNRIAETVDVLTKAEKTSGYRLDLLLDTLSGDKKTVKKGAEGAGKKKDTGGGKKTAAKSVKTTKGKTKK